MYVCILGGDSKTYAEEQRIKNNQDIRKKKNKVEELPLLYIKSYWYISIIDIDIKAY